ncbi:unnamed protein product [Ceratitis capitata]|uniref:(Mediterranean fruit fly) hypothetical protein n=1 Tax=Ceratitis capitata TaxID=7213 RepID=A0A811UU14_CERCA|nr:unnamed protein product [Ceratitis capitata]
MNSAVYRRSAVALAGGTTGKERPETVVVALHAVDAVHMPLPQTMRERGSVAETRLNQQASEELPMINIITNIPSPVNLQPAVGCNNKHLIESMAISETIRRRLDGNTSTVGVPISDTGLNEDARAIFPAKRAIADTILYFIEFIHIPTLLTTHRVFSESISSTLIRSALAQQQH